MPIAAPINPQPTATEPSIPASQKRWCATKQQYLNHQQIKATRNLLEGRRTRRMAGKSVGKSDSTGSHKVDSAGSYKVGKSSW